MVRSSVFLTCILILLASCVGFEFQFAMSVGAAATTWTVDDDGPADFSMIQEAIDAAGDGDTVFVRAGTYYEHVVVNKTILLLGENSNTTVVDGNWTGVVINVIRSGVIISGLTVQRSGNVYWENAGIFLDNVENCAVDENILTENSFAGLLLNYAYRCVVSGNSVFDNSGVGITVVGGGFNNLSRNNISENAWSALTLNDGAHNNTISENSMTSNNLAVTGHCINLYRSSENSIQKNNITGDDNGIRLEYWSNYNTIAKNNITNNTLTGLSVEIHSNYNTIRQNNIGQNGYGFYIESSTQNTIWGNNILDNDQQVYVSVYGSVNDWDDGYPSGGNYWSDYTGTDLNSGPYQNETGSDGIGDTPYIVDDNNTDRYPLIEPWIPRVLQTDLNDDGTVNILDIAIVAIAFGSEEGDEHYSVLADLDENNEVNILDISIVAMDYGKTL